MIITPILERLSQCHLIIGYYHLLSEKPPLHIKHLYACKTPIQFERDIDFLLSRYKPINIPELVASVKARKPLPEPRFLLTFDDGFREGYEVIAPILRRKGVPAVFFINTAFIDNVQMSYEHEKSVIIEYLITSPSYIISQVSALLGKPTLSSPACLHHITQLKYADRSLIGEIGTALNIDFKAYLRDQRPYFTKDQIRRLLLDGFFVGSHSLDHPLYRDVPLEEQLRQTIESIYYLDSLSGSKYGLFAFPHTDGGVTSLFFEKLMETNAVAITFGTSGLLDDSIYTHVQRVNFERPVVPVEYLLRRQLLRRFYRRLRGVGTIYHPLV